MKIPFIADQPVNARQIENLGLGKRMDYKSLDSQLLKETVISVLADEKIKANLDNVQNWIANAWGNQGGAELILEYYRKWGNGYEFDTK